MKPWEATSTLGGSEFSGWKNLTLAVCKSRLEDVFLSLGACYVPLKTSPKTMDHPNPTFLLATSQLEEGAGFVNRK